MAKKQVSELFESIKLKISDIKKFDKNPRVLKDKGYTQLERSIKKNGIVPNSIWVDNDNTIISGNQRIRVLFNLYGDIEVDVMRAKSKLTKEQFDSLMIVSNVQSGEWDTDMLSSEWNTEELWDYGLEFVDDYYGQKKQNKYYNEDGTVKPAVFKAEEYNNDDEESNGETTNYTISDKYTKNITAFKYIPDTSLDDDIHNIYDSSKTDKLLKELIVYKNKIDADVYRLLEYASYRHTVFMYDKIANLYAKSDSVLQKLIEDTSLVIIDYNDAIENGHVKISNKILDIVSNNNKDE